MRVGLKPLGMSAGDFDLAVVKDGKAYYYFERVHSETICADLTEDYTDVTGYYSTHFPHHEGPPYVREATAHFYRKGKHYLVTSGTTGYLPNPSQVAVGDTWHGPFRTFGNPHPEDVSNTSYHSQISSFDFGRMGEQVVENTSIADYVWLPFRFEGERAYLDWKDSWSLEDYE